jgi:precorrin-6B methylase 2
VHIQSLVENELVEDAFSVWRLKKHSEFGYSDGAASEKYLREVFCNTKDLSTRSTELESYIKDWPSEYHLSTKRAQLMSGFSFDRSLRVLEVGCGCGAISRYLGENFVQVISVEGNINRARLARQRTRDLDSVSVICAPFQEIQFSQKFDIIFCIGVFEYSAAFIGGDDPYDTTMRIFSDMLTPDGMIVVAIENQFGLKYFSSAREDHLGVMFEGIEGYHRNPGVARTFGKSELEMRLKKYFSQVEFYYPYPDYKIPDCVFSNEFLASGRAGELVSQMRSRDYSGFANVLWDEAATALELNRNRMLDFFANSFLVLAGRNVIRGVEFDQLGILFSSGRKPAYNMRARIVKGPAGEIRIEKRRVHGHVADESAPLKLVETESPWFDTGSVLTLVTLRAHSRKNSIAEIFEPCRKWVKLLIGESELQGGVRWIDGAHIDSIWGNTYIIGDECRVIDREWVWNEKVRINVVIIRAIYDFFCRIETSTLCSKALSAPCGRSVIEDIASSLGERLTPEDFAEFIRIESEISWIVSGLSKPRQSFYIRWFLKNRPTRRFFRRVNPMVKDLLSRGQARISNLV